MGVVCYYLRVIQNGNVVLLDKLKDAPGVVVGDRVKMGCTTECERLTYVEHSGRLATGIS